MILELSNHGSNEYCNYEGITVFNEAHERMSSAGVTTVQSRYCGKYISTLNIGGVNTDPQYRRNGCVRAIFDRVFSLAPERGWTVSMLHPFSASYYRMFGYEKICDHRVVEFPMASLSNIPRCPDLKPLNSEERLNDALSIYERFGEKRNIMFRRFDGGHYNLKPDKSKSSTYIWYDRSGNPAAYITLWVENYYNVNRMTSINLNIDELVFTTPDSLRALFGFIRMYEGENDTVKITNCAMSPEIDLMLREYVGISYKLIPDIMARILDVKAILEANTYPSEPGHFRVYIDDMLDFTRGLWEVEYIGGKAEAKRTDGDDYDIRAAMPAFTQIIYGYENYTADIARYMDGVELKNDCPDFFRAFPKRYNGLFEHF